MCGIAGFYGNGNENTLLKMAECLKHRGPDSRGYFFDENLKIGLAHTRLSIIDLARGTQPIFSEDGKKAIVFNGEIYNFLKLKKKLENTHKFKTNTDTEVILHLYEDLGEDCLKKLEGMFSFAIFDKTKNSLFLARGRFGEKPLYYNFNSGGFIFGSELKALLIHADIKKELDFLSLAKFLTYDYIPSPNVIFQNIFKLEPGNYLVFSPNEPLIKKQYWDIGFLKQKNENFKDAFTALEEKLNNSVRERLVSEVPLGIFLSGGIDSSTIAYFAAKNSSAKIKTFSIGFDDKSFDESRFARQVAEFLKTEHYEKIFSGKDALDALPQIARFMDEPFSDPSILPTYLLSKFAREYVAVALGGDGGDELFLGYPMFQAEFPAAIYSKIPKIIRGKTIEPFIRGLPVSLNNLSFDFLLKAFINGADYPPHLRHQIWICGFLPDEINKIFTGCVLNEIKKQTGDLFEDLNYLYNKNKNTSRFEKINYLYLKQYLADDILVKTDRAAMFNSLETRSPFLDTELAEFIFSLPYNFKLRGFKTKYIFKKLMESKLPKNIVWRKKKGFGIPVSRWLKSELKNLMLDILDERRIKKGGIFNPEYVKALIIEHLENKKDNRKKLWPLIVFELWKERWYK